MKLLCMADLHGILPQVTTPADVAIIAGDIVNGFKMRDLVQQVGFVYERFIPWLQQLPVKHVVLTWGNHDAFADCEGGSLIPQGWWPDNVHPLVNESVTLCGVTLHGIPQTPRFHDWAFNEDDIEDALGKRWQAVPEGTQILVTHGPPRGTVDNAGGERVGSKTMERWLKGAGNNRPDVVVCGHIHVAGGKVGQLGSTVVYNVACANSQYQPARGPREIHYGGIYD